MKVVYLSSSTIPSDSANGVQVQHMCNAFAQLGHDVVLVAAASASSKIITPTYIEDRRVIANPGYKIFLCKKRRHSRIFSVIYGLYASRFALSIKPDLAYGRCPHSLFHLGRSNIPFKYEAHNMPGGWLRKKIESALFNMRSFRGLVVISRALRDEYLELFPNLSNGFITVAHDGAIAPDVSNLEKYCTFDNHSAKSELDIGYIGSMYPGKGIEGVLELAKMRPKHRYHITGGTEKERQMWKKNASPQVRFHSRINQSEVQKKLRMYDVLLLPAQRRVQTAGGGNIAAYMSPLKMFEYMASGRPMIASNLPVLCEVLVDESNALLVLPDDVNEWANAIDRLANDPDLCSKLARNAYNDLKNKYTWFKRAKTVIREI